MNDKVASDDRFGSCRIAQIVVKFIFAIELEGDAAHSSQFVSVCPMDSHSMGLDCLLRRMI